MRTDEYERFYDLKARFSRALTRSHFGGFIDTGAHHDQLGGTDLRQPPPNLH